MIQTSLLQQLQRRFGSANFCNWQVIRWSYWDTVRLSAAGTSQLTFFANPQGSVDPVSTLAKTLEQTNMVKARTFGQVFFFIHQIKTNVRILPKQRQPANVIALTAANFTSYPPVYRRIINLMNSGVLNVSIGQKTFFDIPMPFRTCPPGFGVDVQSLGAFTAQPAFVAHPGNNPKDCFNVTPVQLVEPEQTLDVTMDFPFANTPVFTDSISAGVTPSIEVSVYLEGYIARPNQ